MFNRNLFIFILFVLYIGFVPRIASAENVATKRDNSFNPSISANMLSLYRNGSRGSPSSSSSPNGFYLQESELQFSADVDVYARANVLLSLHKEGSEWKAEPEEAYAESLNLPSVILKAGKLKASLGKHNMYHTHALPFIDNNLINQVLLGDEGVNAAGFSAEILLPTNWYSEFTAQALNATTAPFSSTSADSTLWVMRFKNLWDISEDTTLEWGLSGAQGDNDAGKTTSIGGSDLTLKWRPSKGGKYSALIWSTEFLYGDKNLNPVGRVRTRGTSSYVQHQVAERWWLQLRGEYLEKLDSTTTDADIRRKESFLIGFVPTEFSAFRLQYDHLEDISSISGFASPENRITLQLNFSIGAHPAHAY